MDIIFLFLGIVTAVAAILIAYQYIPSRSIANMYFKIGLLTVVSTLSFYYAAIFAIQLRGCIVAKPDVRKEEISTSPKSVEIS